MYFISPEAKKDRSGRSRFSGSTRRSLWISARGHDFPYKIVGLGGIRKGIHKKSLESAKIGTCRGAALQGQYHIDILFTRPGQHRLTRKSFGKRFGKCSPIIAGPATPAILKPDP